MEDRHIAVLCALDKEITPVISALEDVSREERYGVTLVEGRRGRVRVSAAVAGMGKSAAAAAAQLLIMRARPEALLFTGIAGGLNPALGIGDIVVGSRLRYLETNESIIAQCDPWLGSFSSDEELVRAGEQVLRTAGYARVASLDEVACGAGRGRMDAGRGRYVCGTIATSDRFNTDAAVLAHIRDVVHADCEEMEGAAAAHISAKNHVAFLAVRSISNRCGDAYEELDERPGDLAAACTAAASITVGVIDLISQA